MTTDEDCGLRERKKRQTRRDLHRAAVELAGEKGGAHAVTVEEIAARAGVSARTFFNYFATKEAALLGSDPDAPAAIAQALLARPADEAPMAALRAVLTTHMRHLQEEREVWVARRRLFETNPELLAAMLGKNYHYEQAAVQAMRTRLDLGPTDPLPNILVAAVMGASRAAMVRYWHEPQTTLIECLDGAFAALEAHWRP